MNNARFLSLLVVPLAACAPSPCRHLANSLSSEVGSCSASPDGGASFLNAMVNVNQCDNACSNIEQTAISEAAACLDAVPQCNASNEASFVSAAGACGVDLNSLGATCLLSVTSPRVDGADGGGFDGGAASSPCEKLSSVLEEHWSQCGFTASSSWISSCNSACGSTSEQGFVDECAAVLPALGSCVSSSGKTVMDAVMVCEVNGTPSSSCLTTLESGG